MRITPETTREDMRRREPGWASRKTPLVSEASLQQSITEAPARLAGASGMTTTRGGNAADFPDLELIRDRIVKAELKRRDTVPTPGQERYLLALARAGVETYLWRPADWAEIVETLKRGVSA